MGYRSDVGLCLSTKGKEALDAALAKAEKSNKDFSDIKRLMDNPDAFKIANDGTVGYLWEYVKWYADYSEVSFIEDLLNGMEEREYLFLRVGESDGDSEYRGNFWDNPLGMLPIRGITFKPWTGPQ